ncbi:MAG: type III-B CRISPR module-associated protein Cmr5 [Candidatus Contendobacter sp.]|nr:type III-B CRISPR module-associated protein Cmr5 [Candidatus Contendobacter sp.]MDG4557004.1 type III-B CRISPR module-associated protein Cmr5 [Candidatus Contendobacter sp.]
MPTLSQQYARAVYTQIDAIRGCNEQFHKDYGRLCNRFPNLVLQNGLAQTLGFLTAKAVGDARSAEGVFLGQLAEILHQPPVQFLDVVINAALPDYRRLTRQALAAAIWYKRFAQSVLGIDATGERSSGDDEGENPDG